MTLSRQVLAILVRAAVLIAVAAALVRWLDVPGDDDGLGTGLLAFLILFVAAGAWGLVDGVRRGFVAACVTWVGTAVLVAVADTVVSNAIDDRALTEDLLASSALFLVLLGVPAVLAAALGGIVHRPRGRDAVPST